MAWSRWQRTQYAIVAAALIVVFIVAFVHPRTPQAPKLLPNEADTSWKSVADSGRHWTTYNLHNPVKGEFDCDWIHSQPRFPVCLFPGDHSSDLSQELEERGIWNPYIGKILHSVMYMDEEVGFLDVGSELGVYSLYAASMGRTTLSIEPNIHYVHALHKAISIGKYEGTAYILQNLISSERGIFTLIDSGDGENAEVLKNHEKADRNALHKICGKAGSNCEEVKAIVLDDLVTYAPFQKVIMRVNLDNLEPMTFRNASFLFKSLQIPLVLLKWDEVVDKHASETKEVTQLLEFLTEKNMEVFDVKGSSLSIKHWNSWPDEIVFVKKGFRGRIGFDDKNTEHAE